MQVVRRSFSRQLAVVLMLSGMATARVPNSEQSAQAPGTPPAAHTRSAAASGGSDSAATLKQGVTITGQAPQAGQPLPKLAPDEFTDCTRRRMGLANPAGPSTNRDGSLDMSAMADMSMTTWLCETKLKGEMQVVIDACLDRSGKNAPPRIIQACTESLAHDVLPSDQRYFLIASRADAYFIHGDWRQALDDYSAAIKLAPHNGELYYDRAVVFASRSEDDAALHDFNTAMGIDSKLMVPALRHRAKIYAARGNLSGALADYSEAISLQPKAAALWSDLGYVALNEHDYAGAVKDEAQAIQLDPKLARAYYLRGVASGDLGNRENAVGDLRAAVGLDASLARYVLIQGKKVTLTLPPL